LKKILLIIIPLAIIAGATTLWYTNEGRSINPLQRITQDKEEEKTDKSTENQIGTLRELIGKQISLKCTWSTEDEVSGTTWIKEGKTFTEVSTPEAEIYSITKDNCVWSWGNSQNQGMKMCYESEDELYTEDSEEEETELPDREKLLEPPTDVEYNCEKLNIEDSKFDPPAEVEFISLEELIPEDLENLEEKVGEMLPENTKKINPEEMQEMLQENMEELNLEEMIPEGL
jgi:hypothetical protein